MLDLRMPSPIFFTQSSKLKGGSIFMFPIIQGPIKEHKTGAVIEIKIKNNEHIVYIDMYM